MTELCFQSATAIAQAIREGRVSAREALEVFLARVEAHNPALNAVVVLDADRARKQADAADAARSRGEPLGPLHGVPMTVKESFDWAGHPTTWGLPFLKDTRAGADALAVQRLTAAGANVFGKTNVPLLLSDFQSYNDVYGVTNNPWGLDRTPGGSSGGSAAALAAGLTGLEIGSDIGGSIRNPAHFCGVFGHKPTFGLAPMRGHSLMGMMAPVDLSVIGPLARSADDLALALDLMKGADDVDGMFAAPDMPRLTKPMDALRVAVWRDDPLCPVSAAVAARVDAVASALAAAGAEVDAAARPDFSAEAANETYLALLWATMAARAPADQYAQHQAKAASFAPDDQSQAAKFARSQVMSLRDWTQQNEARQRIRWAWACFFQRYDVILTPIMPVGAFPHDHSPFEGRRLTIDGADTPYFAPLFWAGLATASYLPATIIPAGQGPDGLPIGVQIIGPAMGDFLTIGLAQRLERMGFAFRPPPGY
jgi:amidase